RSAELPEAPPSRSARALDEASSPTSGVGRSAPGLRLNRSLAGWSNDAASSPSRHLPSGLRLLAGQSNLLRFMADHETFAFSECIFRLPHGDFHIEHLPMVRHGKPKHCAILWRAARPERQLPVVVLHSAKPVRKHHPSTAHRGDMAAILHVA